MTNLMCKVGDFPNDIIAILCTLITLASSMYPMMKLRTLVQLSLPTEPDESIRKTTSAFEQSVLYNF